MALLVTVDLGNTRCKLRAWSDEDRPGAPLAAIDLASRPGLGAEALAWLASRARGARAVALASVASPEVEEELAAALREHAPLALRPSAGLEVDCAEPERVGADRLYAARGALELVGRSAIVVDAGTALTVDALRAGTGRATFLGGAIAPGAALGAEALARDTARLPRVEPRAGVPALGRDTRGALLAGLVHGLRGAARELADAVAREAGLEGSPAVVTGGARSLLLEPSPCFGPREVRVDPELVHRGLLAALRAAPRP